MELTLHIGAHRTGSTMIQRTLADTLAAHPDCGVALWGPDKLRKILSFPSVEAITNEQGDASDPDAALLLNELTSQLEQDLQAERARGVERLIISEENLIGSMSHNFRSGQFYPTVLPRLTAYAKVLPSAPSKVAIGVREYGAVWTSAYFYSEQRQKNLPLPDAMREVMLANSLGWISLVRNVKEVWPDVKLQVWQQKDLSDHAAAVCGALTGLEEEMFLIPKRKVNARNKLAAKKSLFNDDERANLSGRYKRHLNRLKRDKDIEWIGGSF